MKWLMRIVGKDKKSKEGFTLIELLFVVIVIAILAAAGVALYMRSLDKARASEGLAILSSVRTHFLVEWAENDEIAPEKVTFLYDWGIETDKNRWWIENVTTGTEPYAGNFTTDWSGYTVAGTHIVKLVGMDTGAESGSDVLKGIELSIDCDDGTITQTYP